MPGARLEQTVRITNPQGFHLRPLVAFAQLAQRFVCAVTVLTNGKSADGKSPLELMTLAALEGSELTIVADGPDAENALQSLIELLHRPIEEQGADTA